METAAQLLSAAFNLPVEDCTAMIGKDGGIAEGDAHLTNYRENANFFLDPMNPSNYETLNATYSSHIAGSIRLARQCN
jgi:hypothetical protein